jgi:hypothetical protein
MYENYIKMMELFCALNEEIGEAQKSFNDCMWNGKGSNVDTAIELNDIQIVLDEMKDFVYKPMSKEKK